MKKNIEGEPIAEEMTSHQGKEMHRDNQYSSLYIENEENVAEKVPVFTTLDRIANVSALVLLTLVAVTAIISIAAGACALHSIAGLPFSHYPLLLAAGVAPVVVGCVCVILVGVVIWYIIMRAMGFKVYGMCCYTSTKARSALRVMLFGIFPFIIFVILLALCILGFTVYNLSRQIAPLSKDYKKVFGLNGDIEIIRDDNGLTHIKAQSRRDAYFGQGFAEAQDRLFQLEFHRLTAKGELATLIGEKGLQTDIEIRTLNLRDAAYGLCDRLSNKNRQYLEAFADGVNLFLQEESKRPVEFFFLGPSLLKFHNPKPFSYLDICLTARLIQWQMSSNFASEGERFNVWAKTGRSYSEVDELYSDSMNVTNTILSQEQMVDLMINNGDIVISSSMSPEERKAAINDALKNNIVKEETGKIIEEAVYDNLFSIVRTLIFGNHSQLSIERRSQHKKEESTSNLNKVTRTFDKIKETASQLLTKHLVDEVSDKIVYKYKRLYASNAWATTSSKGQVMAASDPHLTTNLPTIWYYTHLMFPDDNGSTFEASGMCVVGIPGVHIGKTPYLSWGITMSMTDLEDMFVIPPPTFTGLKENEYWYNGTVHQLTERHEKISVKGKKDYDFIVEDSIFGPVISDLLGLQSSLKVALYAVPLRKDDSTSFDALLAMTDPTIKTADALMNALVDLQTPGFSIPIGDTKGNIAYAVTGKHPLRNMGHTGKFPTCACDGYKVIDQICRLIYARQGHVIPDKETCTLPDGAVNTLNITLLQPYLPGIFKNISWHTYVSSERDVADARVPKEANPHVFIPFNNSAAAISAANQKIVPNGYPYYLGYDYAWPYRGARVQELIEKSVDQIERQDTHMSIQLDKQSNIWTIDFKAIVDGSEFQQLINKDSSSQAWVKRLLAWDGKSTIGSVEAAFFWRWLQRMAVLPRDVMTTLNQSHWGLENRYIVRMITANSTRMHNDCLREIGATSSTPDACMIFAAQKFVEQASNQNFKERWGIETNNLEGIHELLETTAAAPIFQRKMHKAGDMSSICVSDHSVDDNFPSQEASSMRQLYDLWNNTNYMYVALPGGQSGNPYSRFYQNLWDKYAVEEYVSVPVNISALNSEDYYATQKLKVN